MPRPPNTTSMRRTHSAISMHGVDKSVLNNGRRKEKSKIKKASLSSHSIQMPTEPTISLSRKRRSNVQLARNTKLIFIFFKKIEKFFYFILSHKNTSAYLRHQK